MSWNFDNFKNHFSNSSTVYARSRFQREFSVRKFELLKVVEDLKTSNEAAKAHAFYVIQISKTCKSQNDMKRLLFIFTMLITTININAEKQCDVILTINNFQIPCTIVKIGETEVQYKECPSTIDKLVIVSINDIQKIYLSDGTIMDYTQSSTQIATNVKQQENDASESSKKPKVVNVGEEIRLLSSSTSVQQQKDKDVRRTEQPSIPKPMEEEKLTQNMPQSEVYDIILTTDANKIEAKITEVSKSEIRYKEKDNIDGPTFVLDASDIHSILYANGKVVLYNQQSTDNTSNNINTAANVTNVTRRIKYIRKDFESPCLCDNVKIEIGEAYNDWKKWLDYINIVEHINIHKYRSIYVFPIDITQIQLSDNQYFAVAEALESFPNIIREHIISKFNHLNVIVVDTYDEVQMPEASIGLCLRFDEFELISNDSGIQKITLSGVVIDNKHNHLFDFKQRHLTMMNRSVLVNLKKEFKNFAEDICRIFENLR